MPRGRHRHSPPLHRLLSPVAVAASGLVCAGGAWLVPAGGYGDPQTLALRGLTAAAAIAATTGAVLLRTWDRAAGREVSALRAKQATADWKAEERQAELESEADELRQSRTELERHIQDKRAELTRLRSEHAALLRRYAQAETERANALEGRRQLQLEAAEPAKALTAEATDHRQASGAPTPLTYLQAREALKNLRRSAARQQAQRTQEKRATEWSPRPITPQRTEQQPEERRQFPPQTPPQVSRQPSGTAGPAGTASTTGTEGAEPTDTATGDSGADDGGRGFDFFGNRSPRGSGKAPEQPFRPERPQRSQKISS